MKAHLSQAIETGDLVFTSGQLAFDENGQLQEGGAGEQTTQALRNLQRVLANTGLDLSDVVKTTVWITNITDFTAFNDAYAAMFGDHMPTRSTVVAQLVLPGALVEIEAVARRRTT
jgi:2-iminobutanoate/2-iminopropanoate deaminase